VVVVGENGSGKTNLLEALSMLSPGRGLRRALANELPAFGSADWRVAANLRGRTEAHEIITKSDGRRRSVELNGKASSQTALASVLRVLWLTPAMDRLWVDTPAERRRFLDRLTMSLVPEHAEATIRYERALKERNRLLRDGARDNAWYLALEEQMATHGVLVVAYRRKIIARLRELRLPSHPMCQTTRTPSPKPWRGGAPATSPRAEACSGRIGMTFWPRMLRKEFLRTSAPPVSRRRFCCRSPSQASRRWEKISAQCPSSFSTRLHLTSMRKDART
jgi:energy-coupling factor transporter ATP-binding protein EcfA2